MSGTIATGGNFFDDVGRTLTNVFAPKQPDLQKPPAAPTLGNAAEKAMSEALKRERRLNSTSAYLTGGQGLTDTPMTSSRVLIGY